MINIIIGILMIVAGLSGKVVLMFTDSGMALVGIGVVLVIWGVVQLARGGRRGGEQ